TLRAALYCCVRGRKPRERHMKYIPLSALFLFACGSSASSTSNPSTSTEPVELGTATEAIQKLGRLDADVVQRCEQLAQRCQTFATDAADSGVTVAAVCEKISDHCAELAEQLSEVREELEACLEGVAACEASDADPSVCRDQRRACSPAGQNFDVRRGETLACAERTQTCLPRERMGRALNNSSEADAGAVSCDADALDFKGCCHGGPGGGRGLGRGNDRPGNGGLGNGGFGNGRPGAGDAGVAPPQFGGANTGGPGPRAPRFTDGAGRGNDGRDADQRADDADDSNADDDNN
ncbi:MAG: hypothetical protein RL685_7583, partial [Pseudomonadota bacterium]